MLLRAACSLLALACIPACAASSADRDSGPPDSGRHDAGSGRDAGTDAGGDGDAGHVDAGGAMDAGERDAGEAMDAGDVDAGDVDAGGGADGGDPDAGGTDAGGTDAGPATIVIDGTVTAAEWAGAEEATSSTASSWGAGLNELRVLRAAVRDGSLWVAVEGTVEPTNGIVLYVDADLGDTAGIEDPILLTDGTGATDNRLSAGLTTPSSFRADFGWGTRLMDYTPTGTDDDAGWRDIATDPADFAWIDSGTAPTVCGTSACETRIPLSTLGGSGSRTIALFARITNDVGTDFSNQTLPMDVSTAPETVSVTLGVPVP